MWAEALLGMRDGGGKVRTRRGAREEAEGLSEATVSIIKSLV